LWSASIEDAASVLRVVNEVKPDEVYHLAAQSFVGLSFKDPFNTMTTNVNGTLNMLSAVYTVVPECRFYFAASSEMFGEVTESPQNEQTPFHPRSPYGISKVDGFNMTRYYREAFGLFACSGILFNHESPRRGPEFVTRKIARMAARIAAGCPDKLKLGNLAPKRDWGFAPEYTEAMWLMLQHGIPTDYVIATGENHSIEDFVSVAFNYLGLDWHEHVVIDSKYWRPAEVESLRGNSNKARKAFGWKPKTKFTQLVQCMVDAEVEKIE